MLLKPCVYDLDVNTASLDVYRFGRVVARNVHTASRARAAVVPEAAMRYNAAIAPAEGEMAALLKKAEGPWGELSVENKVQLYRAIYKTTRSEIKAAQGGDGMFVFGGTVVGILAGFGLFSFVHANFINPKRPGTMEGSNFNADVNQATKDKQTAKGLNPMEGYGSAEFKASYGK